MKTTFSLFIFCLFYLFSIDVVAQGIVFEQGSWPAALRKARKEKKLLFLHFDSPACGGCNEVASRAFESPLLREKFAQHFIAYRTNGTTGVGKGLADQYEVPCVPSSIFLDLDENPLARFCGTTSFDRAYLEKAEEALIKNRERPMKALSDAYARGDRSAPLMRQYITRRREMGLSVGPLLDEYVGQLPADSLRSGAVLRFLFEQGPIVGSKADSVFRRDYRLTDSLYRAVGWSKAVELNNLITTNSIRKAVKEKNRLLASRTAGFRQRTYTNDPQGGRMARDWVMLSYYKGVNDTLTYLTRSVAYYDTYLMPARVDSVQKLDELDMQRRMKGQLPPPTAPTAPGLKPGMGTASFTPYPNTQRFVTALNHAAWEFYEMTRDTTFLRKALTWSKRSLEYREDGSLMDTYAHLLYRLGRREEALEWQEKAVRQEQQRNSPLLGSLQESLRKMRTGTL